MGILNVKEISLIQIMPMTYEPINCSTIDEAQKKFFINELLEREGCAYYLNSSIKADKNTLLLFQLESHIIACAMFKELVELDTNVSENKYAILLYPETIQVFKPIPKKVLFDVTDKVKTPDHIKYKVDNPQEIKAILELIEVNIFGFALSKKCFQKRLAVAEAQSKNMKLEELIELSRANFTGNKKYFTETVVYNRNPYLKTLVKRYAKGYCQLCEQRAPFLDSYGEAYLEVHHVVRLADGGLDELGNVVALCPNCHRKVHVLNDKHDLIKLKKVSEEIKNKF